MTDDDIAALADRLERRIPGHKKPMADDLRSAAELLRDLALERDALLDRGFLACEGGQLTTMRRFELHRDEDVSGVSGTGLVAEGVAFSNDGPVALRWMSEWPTSVVFHDRGVESLEAVHGHSGRTRIVWLDGDR